MKMLQYIIALLFIFLSMPLAAQEIDIEADPEDADVVDSKSQIKIALMLPLTGSYSAIGKSSLKAAEMAVFDAENLGEEILLLPVDTGVTEQDAKNAASKALKLNPDIIIGPILSNTTKIVSLSLKGRNIPIIALANNSSIAVNGTYVMGYFPEDQVIRVIEFARKKGIGKFYSILPEDRYGEKVAEAMKNTLLADSLEPEQIIWVGEGKNNIETAAVKIQELTNQDKGKADGNSKQAILIPSGGSTLNKILEKIPTNSMRILGSSDWEDAEVLNKQVAKGAWFAVPPQELYQVFSAKFKKSYGEYPFRTSSLVYDAVSLAANLAAISPTAPYSPENFTRPEGFMGVNGIFRFRSDGRVDRRLAVVEVSPNGFVEIDPSAEGF
jgi:branched-chain amino acid transport system substrate-binding protein